jgi:phosphogluconate dehydratase
VLAALVPQEVWAQRTVESPPPLDHYGSGRELFGVFRRAVTDAEAGAVSCRL